MSSNSGIVDVLVIGSGAAGGALAKRLAEKDAQVMCLEQGDWRKRWPRAGRIRLTSRWPTESVAQQCIGTRSSCGFIEQIFALKPLTELHRTGPFATKISCLTTRRMSAKWECPVLPVTQPTRINRFPCRGFRWAWPNESRPRASTGSVGTGGYSVWDFSLVLTMAGRRAISMLKNGTLGLRRVPAQTLPIGRRRRAWAPSSRRDREFAKSPLTEMDELAVLCIPTQRGACTSNWHG